MLRCILFCANAKNTGSSNLNNHFFVFNHIEEKHKKVFVLVIVLT